MAKLVDVPTVRLDDYEEYAALTPSVRQLRDAARQATPLLDGRTLWMINSTERGGGVAEMLPAMVGILRDLGVSTEWVAIESEDPTFFTLTKRIHNLIHGEGEPGFDTADRELFEAVNRQNADWLLERVRPGDIVAIHDPQPMPLAAILAEKVAVESVWRCHIGVDETNARTHDVWEFLHPYAGAYRTAIFTAPEYIPDYFANRATVIHPALDPLTCKNREISVHKIASVMANSALSVNPGPVLSAPFTNVAERLLPNGRFAPANMTEDIGLIHRPIVAQISRWDRLKGFAPLMEAFARIKTRLYRDEITDPVEHRRLELVRLVLAGPRLGTIADDPEGAEVLDDLVARYRELDPMTQRDLALITLPMESVDENALMTNAIQRTSSIVVQNSIREGFGLTVTEAMWKGIPVLSNRRAVGPRLQVRDGIDGCLIDDPTDPDALADVLRAMLGASADRDRWGRSARRHAHQEFLVFTQLERWLQLLADLVRRRVG